MDREKLLKILEDYFGFSNKWKDGAYFYNLTRTKSAFGVGTVTIDDFEEIQYEQIEELANIIMKQFS